MKWFLLLHFFNLYVLPAVGYFSMLQAYGSGTAIDYAMALLFGYIPAGCFLISFIYGFRKREALLWYCFVCAFLGIPLSFLRVVSGDGVMNHIRGGLIMYCGYFLFAFLGSMTGFVGYLGYKAAGKLANRGS